MCGLGGVHIAIASPLRIIVLMVMPNRWNHRDQNLNRDGGQRDSGRSPIQQKHERAPSRGAPGCACTAARPRHSGPGLGTARQDFGQPGEDDGAMIHEWMVPDDRQRSQRRTWTNCSDGTGRRHAFSCESPRRNLGAYALAVRSAETRNG